MFEQLREKIPNLERETLLAPYTTFDIGGPAQFLYEPKNDDDLVAALRAATELSLPVTLMAGGSNLVIADEGVRGLVLIVRYGGIRELGGVRIECDAGVDLAALIDHTTRRGLAGLEALSGIPGTVGGAVVGNAGAYGQSIAGTVEGVRIFDGETIRTISPEQCAFSYRMSAFKSNRNWIVLSTRFRFVEGDAKALQKKSREIIAIREAKQYKPGLKCPGSYFKNVLVSSVSPEVLGRIDQSKIIEGKIPAGYLLESVGAKGMVEGGAEVTPFHGNVIVNKNNAKAADVRKLAEKIKVLVREKYGIDLEEEIRYIG